ncbi:DUF1249 domain-containing protein [Ferrimonas marina]|uniref:DUF1249 domain-containing protein n=1 Tax=Ferrimonas marina TaxID=299255 RepID=A0A1M5X6J5_9GAMM|nr:DUF1249 domain-containing protein [Ferrimonas marina]SHH95124.1 hypothetical protein SAMN02745129_3250 [Ferrimonas marina]
MKTGRYSPSLDALLRLCSRNYRSLTGLLLEGRRRQGDDQRCFEWRHAQEPVTLRLELHEQTRYTEVVTIERLAPPLPFVDPPRMEVRLYHDARVAEVLTGQHFSRFLPVYPYPNAKMLQRDEKFQVNLFLAELLEQFRQSQWQLTRQGEESRKL